MSIKRVLCPQRVRRIPAQFSWVDHRLVRHGHLRRCDAAAAALYLFLVTVADAQGLSYYGDEAIGRHLSMPAGRVAQARIDLLRVGLIDYARPLYQVLALDEAAPIPIGVTAPVSCSDGPAVHADTAGGDLLELDELRKRSRALRQTLERKSRDRL